MTHRICAPVLATIIAATCFDAAIAAPKYGPGASDKEIKIGQTTAYSGAFSAWSAAAQVQAAYFKMLNEKGGVNGRKINFVSLDDSYSPPKTVEQTRRLVESDEVLFLLVRLARHRIRQFTNISTPRRFRSYSLSRARRSGRIRRNSRGPWDGCRLSQMKGLSMESMCLPTFPMRKSLSSFRTTTTERTTSRASRELSAPAPRR